uniref:Uncharacterized protein n=1 Tax=Siphoviridae sp. ctuUw41 TaxID=2826503 RepID=A0A8S5MXU5_9CAUD|nr:MAG TPA: hypothetical protein [Siphoviridae sp. ctuUw41]
MEILDKCFCVLIGFSAIVLNIEFIDYILFFFLYY